MNAACAGPRRASSTISRIPEPAIASIARSVVSVGCELLARQRQHPRDVERDVPGPDDDRPLDREVELEVLEVGMAVVPGDELGRRPRAGEVLARNAEPVVRLRADGVDDRVVEADEVVVRDCRSRPRRSRRSESPASAPSARTRARRPSASGGRARRRGGRAPTASAGARSCRPRPAGRRSAARSRRRTRPGPEPTTATRRGRASAASRSRNRSHAPACASAAASSSTWNEWPQPHEDVACGLSILKPDSWRPSSQSIVAPVRYGALNGSTTIVTPCCVELVVALERAAVEAEAVLEAGAAAALDRDPEHVGLAGGLGRLELAHLFGRALGQLDEGLDGCHGPHRTPGSGRCNPPSS